MKKESLQQLLKLIGPGKWVYIGAMIALALAVAMETLGNLVIRYIVDDVLINWNGTKPLLISGGLFALFSIARGIFFFLEGRGKSRTSEEVARSIRKKIYDHILRLSFSYHDNSKSGELVQRSTSDVDTVRRFYVDQVPQLLKILLLFVINLTALLFIHWQLALLSTIVMPLMVFISRFFFLKIFRTYEDYQNQEGLMTSRIQENLSGIRVVRAFARQVWENSQFKGINEKQRDLGFRNLFWHNLYWPVAHTLCGTQFMASLIIGAILVIREQLSPGSFVAFSSMINALIWPLQELGRVITEFSKSLVSLGRIQEILKEEQEDLDKSSVPSDKAIEGDLEFRNLHFSYNPETPVLKDISLKVRRGEKIALLGATGSGKTSLVNLLPRFYDYDGGDILLDGVPLTHYSRKFLRSHVGIVQQEPFLFSLSIAENIAYSLDHEVSRQQIEEAARAAAIHDSIQDFAQGYDTAVGEKGVSLSGGQKQRLTIARTLLKDPKILILDDSTSAVDAETEEQIRQALNRLMEGRTTFIIAHRIQTLQLADRIVVLEEGRIVQTGTHDELIKIPGFYREVFDLQTRVEEELEEELISASASGGTQ